VLPFKHGNSSQPNVDGGNIGLKHPMLQ
jgi:hypothetical protein